MYVGGPTENMTRKFSHNNFINVIILVIDFNEPGSSIPDCSKNLMPLSKNHMMIHTVNQPHHFYNLSLNLNPSHLDIIIFLGQLSSPE